MKTEYGRRRFIERTLAFSASLVYVRRLRPTVEDATRSTPAIRLVDLLRDQGSAAVVGRECIRLFPGETIHSHLEALTRDIPRLASALDAADTSLVRRVIAARSRWDFDHDRIVDVDGWVLSSTEARLYALAALLEAGA